MIVGILLVLSVIANMIFITKLASIRTILKAIETEADKLISENNDLVFKNTALSEDMELLKAVTPDSDNVLKCAELERKLNESNNKLDAIDNEWELYRIHQIIFNKNNDKYTNELKLEFKRVGYDRFKCRVKDKHDEIIFSSVGDVTEISVPYTLDSFANEYKFGYKVN